MAEPSKNAPPVVFGPSENPKQDELITLVGHYGLPLASKGHSQSFNENGKGLEVLGIFTGIKEKSKLK